MVRDLPKDIQNRVLYFLDMGNFVAAKQLHDVFFEQLVQSKTNGQQLPITDQYDEKEINN